MEERWQTTAFAVIEQKGAEPAGSWPLRPHGEGGGAETGPGGISAGTGSLFIITGHPLVRAGPGADLTRN